MLMVMWVCVDLVCCVVVVEVVEVEFGVYGFFCGSLNVIVWCVGVVKGSLFQYFVDKCDFYVFIVDIVSQ